MPFFFSLLKVVTFFIVKICGVLVAVAFAYFSSFNQLDCVICGVALLSSFVNFCDMIGRMLHVQHASQHIRAQISAELELPHEKR